MNNIKQLTNFDLNNITPIYKKVIVGGDREENYPYKEISQEILGAPIFKMGYCAEVKGINYPIFITVNGEQKEIQIGKTGMYEFQPEVWQDVNVSEEEFTSNVTVTKILVPDKIKFVLDYCYTV